MSDPGHGFHPVQRVVVRMARISPHRQIQILFAISLVTVVIMVGGVLGSLGPTQSSLRFSSENLAPTIDRLDTARDNYTAVSSALVLTANGDPVVRTSAIAEVASLNSAGDAAWRIYVRTSAHLPGERALRRSVLAHRQAAFGAGSALVREPTPSAGSLANVTRYSDALREDINQLRGLYEHRVHQSLTDSTADVTSTQRQILLVSGAGILILLIAFGVAARSARTREERLELLDRALHEDAERNELEARLQRALEMAQTETASFHLLGRALTTIVPGVPAELLVADSSHSHFHQAATTDARTSSGCPVSSPEECPAATWGQTQRWNSSAALDACPYLQGRTDGECSAVCVPISIAGKTVGVVHATGPDRRPPDEPVVERIELIARKVGERVGMLRAFARSETQAHTDPLTGLMNRRSLEERMRRIIDEGKTYVAAYGDLDHFKQLNDVHGHDAGDQALRRFARVLRDTVRPNDLTARYGGEEFVIVLPDCTIPDAYAVVDRIRERLALAQIGASAPQFTVSFGIASSLPEQTFSEILEVADAALRDAKAKGRDRVIVADSEAQNTGSMAAPASIDAPTISNIRS